MKTKGKEPKTERKMSAKFVVIRLKGYGSGEVEDSESKEENGKGTFTDPQTCNAKHIHYWISQ